MDMTAYRRMLQAREDERRIEEVRFAKDIQAQRPGVTWGEAIKTAYRVLRQARATGRAA